MPSKPILPIENIHSLPDCDVLCVYEVKEKLCIDLEQWLSEKDNRTILLFHENEKGQAFFSQDTDRFRRYDLCGEDREEIFKQIAWEFLFLDIRFCIDPSQGDFSCKRAREVFSRIAFFFDGVHLLASDYRDLGAKINQNISANARKACDAKDVEKLAGKFRGVPAIICGAGPSLAKNGHLLHALSNRALIFAGGSSLNALCANATLPHFAASIDPDPPYHLFFEQTCFEVPFFYQNRVSNDLLSLVHGQMIKVADSGNYPLEKWLNVSLGLSSTPFDGGWNVSTFLCALAAALGCGPIILVGMDLAYTNGLMYAPGVEGVTGDKPLILEGGLSTKKDWMMAADWIASFARSHSAHFINATEGGIGFEDMEMLPLQDAADRYLRTSYDIKGLVHSQLLQVPPFSITSADVNARLKSVEESLLGCHRLIEDFLNDLEKTYPHFTGYRGRAALLEVELESEIAHENILLPLWEVWKYPVSRNFAGNEIEQILNKWLFFRKAINEIREEKWQKKPM